MNAVPLLDGLIMMEEWLILRLLRDRINATRPWLILQLWYHPGGSSPDRGKDLQDRADRADKLAKEVGGAVRQCRHKGSRGRASNPSQHSAGWCFFCFK